MGSSKLLLFTDYHISSKGRRTLRRLDECVKTSKWIAANVKEHKPDIVVNLGDTFDSHSTIDVPSLCTGVRVMETIMDACNDVSADFIIIPGNHDAYSRDYSSLEAFQGIGATVVWEPTVIAGILGAIPFNKNAEMVTEWLHELEKKSLLTVAHVDVKHANYFSGGPNSDIGVDAEAFRGPIYCGHYHHPHTLGAFEFIGSVMHHNFSDKELPDTPRGLVVIEIGEDGVVTSSKRIPNPHTAIYHKMDWSKKKEKLRTIKLYGSYEDRMHLRVKCDYKDVKQVRSDLREMFPKLLACTVVGINYDTQEVTREATIKIDTDPGEALTAYIKNKGVPKDLDEAVLLEMGKRFLVNVTEGMG